MFTIKRVILIFLIFSMVIPLLLTNSYAHDDDSDEYPEFEILATMDISLGEQPQGMTVLRDGRLAVSFPFLNELRIYDPESGELLETISELPAIFGLITDNNGDVLATALSAFFDPDNSHQHGVWRIPVNGKPATQIAEFSSDNLPVHMVITRQHEMLVSDILMGKIYKIDGVGNVTVWADDAELFGSHELPGPVGRPPFPVGIEGIHIKHGYLYGVVADFGRIVRFPINTDGSAGPIEVLLERPEQLLGLAQFVFDDENNMFAVSGFQSEIYRITPRNIVSIIGTRADGVDTPAAIVIGKGESSDKLFVTNFAFVTNNAGGDAKPSLMMIEELLED